MPYYLAIILAVIVTSYAITAWVHVRLKRCDVKMAKIAFRQEQLQFARDQHRDIMASRPTMGSPPGLRRPDVQ